MLAWFFRFEATHGGGAVAGALVDTFPFYAEASAAAGRSRRTVGVDTGTDLHPTQTLLVSRAVFLDTFATLQALAVYFTLALWNYMGTVRLLHSTTIVVAEEFSRSESSPSTLLLLLLPPSGAGLALAYLALTVAGLLFTCITAVTVCVANRYYCDYYSFSYDDDDDDPSVLPLPRFLFPTHDMPSFDMDYEASTKTRAAAAAATRSRVSPQRQEPEPKGPAEAFHPPTGTAVPPPPPPPPPPVSQRGPRRKLTFTIPLPQVQLPQVQRRRRPRPPLRQRNGHGDGGGGGLMGQHAQQLQLYVAFALVVALTALDMILIAQTARRLRGDGPLVAGGGVVLRLTVLQILTPVVGFLLALYTLRWVVTFLVMSGVAATQNALAAFWEARGA